jgi:prolyl oligopeptidase
MKIQKLFAVLVASTVLLSMSACNYKGRAPELVKTVTNPDLPQTDSPDSYLWLESVDSPEATAWVKTQNARTASQLKTDVEFADTKAKVAALKGATDRLATPDLIGDSAYNLWKDDAHPRGLFRRAKLTEYRAPTVNWESVIDLDALSKTESKNWVWEGIYCLAPENVRCLISLSVDGKDASVIREFDLTTKAFVTGGFYVPEAKTDFTWLDQDHIFVSSTLFPNGSTESGYANQVHFWTRGTPLLDAPLMAKVPNNYIGIGMNVGRDHGSTSLLLQQIKTFFTFDYSVFDLATKTMQKVPMDPSADYFGVFHGNYMFRLNQAWSTFPEGALVAVKKDDLSSASLVWAPTTRVSLDSVTITANRMMAVILDHVEGKLVEFLSTTDGAWTLKDLGLPAKGTISFAASEFDRDSVIVAFQNYLTPATLFEIQPSTSRDTYASLKSSPPRFDASKFEVDPLESTSKDGEKIPYFVVHKKGLVYDGSNPTILYGYGGFLVSMTPYYLGSDGTTWLEKGGVYVVANIRGGGEFGPAWHEAARRDHRQRAYDDFISVAEALIKTGVSSPRRLAISGGSNGGLLVGAVFVQRPELFNAVLCDVPLLDMLRFPYIGAGASWIDEYGDPRIATDAAFISKYSPYQNVRSDVHYPKVFFNTATSDDRVGPAHARKMAAKMLDMNHDILFYESAAGGHTGSSDLNAEIEESAMKWVYLYQQLVR